MAFFTVIFDQGQAGAATAGFVAENQAAAFKTLGAIPEIAKVVNVEATTATVAINGVKKAYGGPTNGKYRAVDTSTLTEEAPTS
jgi:hypothetical protein